MTRHFRRKGFLLGLLIFASCDKGDWFPFERNLRELFGGWDMWDTVSVSPHQVSPTSKRLLTPPEGAVPVQLNQEQLFEKAKVSIQKKTSAERDVQAKEAYRRYCHHCHGANGDARIIVGESFDVLMRDLRLAAVQELADEDLFSIIMDGSGKMIPLRDTLTPENALLSILRMRQLKNAPSKPFLSPKDTAPLQ